MNDDPAPSPAVSRRALVKLAVLGGVGLAIGIRRHDGAAAEDRPAAEPWAPNEWVRIDASGVVTVVAARSEMGQGVRTSLPMIVADELGARWVDVKVEHARPGPRYPRMRTAGSGSVAGSWQPLRIAAAAAREMLVAAAAAQWSVEPGQCTTEDGAVVHRASGRKLAFGELVARAAALPVPASPTLRPASERRLAGRRVGRVDAPAMVKGTAVYGLDARPAGVPVALVARPAQLGAKPGRWNEAAARAIPGVVSVVQVPTGIAVLARDTWTAMKARDALKVEWEERPAEREGSREWERTLEEGLEQGKLARHDGGDVAQALAAGARRMQATYHTGFQPHLVMEPPNCVADVRDGRCDIRVGTQAPNEVQRDVAKLLGVPPENVNVEVTLMGGGFGRRLDIDYALEAVEVSRAARSPVQVVWTREDDVRHDRYQPMQVNRLEAALDAGGMPVAWRHRVADFNLTMFGAYDPNYDPAADGDPWGGFDTPYAFPALDVTLALRESPVPTGAWRAVTYPAAVFARESFVDEIARATGRDPVDLRLAMIPAPGAVRGRTLTLNNGDRLREVVRLAATRAGWGAPFARARDGRRWGRGIACNAYHGQTMVAQVADVSVGASGDLKVHRVVCAVDCGEVVDVAGLEAQFQSGVAWALSALRTQVTFERGRARQSGFGDLPVLRIGDMPVVELHAVRSELPPFGAGEQPVPAVWPAVMNAYFDATGVRVRRLPFTA